MAEYSAMRAVPKWALNAQPTLKKHVSGQILDMLMNAVKVEAVFGEVIVSLEPIREEEGPEFGEVSFRQAVNLTPLVRCRECRYRDPEDKKCDIGRLARAGCIFPVDDDYFCAYGKRKDGGQDP